MITDYTINIDELKDLAKRYPDIVAEETKEVMEIIVARLESEVVEKTPKGVGGGGGLAGSIEGKVHMGRIVRGSVGTPLAYGEVVELGRKAGKFPPVAPLELWVRRVLGLPEDEAPGVALAIAWKIYHHGTEGVHMFKETSEELEPWATSMLHTIASRVIRRIQ